MCGKLCGSVDALLPNYLTQHISVAKSWDVAVNPSEILSLCSATSTPTLEFRRLCNSGMDSRKAQVTEIGARQSHKVKLMNIKVCFAD